MRAMPQAAPLAPFVAIVDDEEPVRKALERLLRAAGLQAKAFASSEAFFDSIAARRPDCLILDLHIPGTSGLQVLRRLRADALRIPTIVITAYDETDTREQCLAAGAAAYLRKPLDDRLLLNAISAARARAAAQR
jgi:FixJ family two-component response regulator